MGSDAFFAAMRSIVTTYKFGMATTSGVLAIFEAQSSVDLRPLSTNFQFQA